MRFVIVCWLAVLVWTPAAASEARDARAPHILVMGDSLSAAYGMDRHDGWVALLGERLADAGYPHRIVNASVSGETTVGGLRRLPAQLARHQPALVIVELGANDGLRGQPIAVMRDNLSAMVRTARDAGARVLILGMRIPTNYGAAYAEAFHDAFAAVADDLDVARVQFFLEPIALDESAFQDDGIHPSAAAQPALLDHVWPTIRGLLDAPAHASKSPVMTE